MAISKKISSELFYDKLYDYLKPILETISNEKLELINRNKPIIISDNKYHHRLFYAIVMFCRENRELLDNNEALDKYSKLENAKSEYLYIIKLMYYINTEYRIEFQLDKKLICMLLGINIDSYNWLSSKDNTFDSNIIFKDIEELLISIKQNSAELSTRNAVAVEKHLTSKAEYGGHSVSYAEKQIITSKPREIDYKDREAVRKNLKNYDFDSIINE